MSEPRVPYAGIATRAVALAADAAIAHAILFAGGAVLALVFSLAGDIRLDTLARILAACAWVAVIGTYFVLFWSTAGQTPAMRAMGLRVLAPDGGHPGLVRSMVRVVGLALAIIPLGAGFLPVLVNDRRRGLHDMLARTVVVYAEAEPAGDAQVASTSAPPSAATLRPNRTRAGWDASLPATSASPSRNPVAPASNAPGANESTSPM
jgi:uncharacterized RDD family membrane protein YckC